MLTYTNVTDTANAASSIWGSGGIGLSSTQVSLFAGLRCGRRATARHLQRRRPCPISPFGNGVVVPASSSCSTSRPSATSPRSRTSSLSRKKPMHVMGTSGPPTTTVLPTSSWSSTGASPTAIPASSPSSTSSSTWTWLACPLPTCGYTKLTQRDSGGFAPFFVCAVLSGSTSTPKESPGSKTTP